MTQEEIIDQLELDVEKFKDSHMFPFRAALVWKAAEYGESAIGTDSEIAERILEKINEAS